MFKILILVLFPFYTATTAPSPLAKFSSEWNDPKYLRSNTAADISYMNEKEKEIIYILNLARTDPKLFASTVLEQYHNTRFGYKTNIPEFKSLLITMRTMKRLDPLMPDISCYNSAQCHAESSGREAYVGHERRNKECLRLKDFNGECCDYGHDQPLDIVMSLLVDSGVPGLGHRMICFDSYQKIGVSLQPHKGYGYNAVMDFVY